MLVGPRKTWPPGLKLPVMVSEDCTGGDGGVMSRSVTVKITTWDKAGVDAIESHKPDQRIE